MVILSDQPQSSSGICYPTSQQPHSHSDALLIDDGRVLYPGVHLWQCHRLRARPVPARLEHPEHDGQGGRGAICGVGGAHKGAEAGQAPL